MYFKRWSWLIEWQTPDEAVMRRILDVHAWKTTPYQEVAVVELAHVGKCLVIDGRVQSALGDEFIYHEALVHPAMVAQGNPRSVLILGGGEGATLREALRYRTVERVTMVDIDKDVVDFAKVHLGEWHQGAFEEPRATVVIDDGRRYVERAVAWGERYDVVIADLVDPAEGGPAQKLYTLEFYEMVKRLVGREGVFVTQATSPAMYPEVFARLYWTLKHVFREVSSYMVYVRSFGSVWGFHVASESVNVASLTPSDVDERLSRLLLEGSLLRFYDGVTHAGIFALPKHVRELLSRPRKPSTDADTVA